MSKPRFAAMFKRTFEQMVRIASAPTFDERLRDASAKQAETLEEVRAILSQIRDAHPKGSA